MQLIFLFFSMLTQNANMSILVCDQVGKFMNKGAYNETLTDTTSGETIVCFHNLNSIIYLYLNC